MFKLVQMSILFSLKGSLSHGKLLLPLTNTYSSRFLSSEVLMSHFSKGRKIMVCHRRWHPIF